MVKASLQKKRLAEITLPVYRNYALSVTLISRPDPFVDQSFDAILKVIGPNGKKHLGMDIPVEIFPFFENDRTVGPILETCPSDIVELSPPRCVINAKDGQARVTVTFRRCTCDVPGQRRIALRFFVNSCLYAVDACVTPFMTCVRYRMDFKEFVAKIEGGAWWKDEGGKNKTMEVRQIRILDAYGEVPMTTLPNVVLCYADGTRVADQSILSYSSTFTDNGLLGIHDLIMYFRIEQVSKLHKGKQFILMIHPDADADADNLKHSHISPATTSSVEVKSKRNGNNTMGNKSSGNNNEVDSYCESDGPDDTGTTNFISYDDCEPATKRSRVVQFGTTTATTIAASDYSSSEDANQCTFFTSFTSCVSPTSVRNELKQETPFSPSPSSLITGSSSVCTPALQHDHKHLYRENEVKEEGEVTPMGSFSASTSVDWLQLQQALPQSLSPPAPATVKKEPGNDGVSSQEFYDGMIEDLEEEE